MNIDENTGVTKSKVGVMSTFGLGVNSGEKAVCGCWVGDIQHVMSLRLWA